MHFCLDLHFWGLSLNHVIFKTMIEWTIYKRGSYVLTLTKCECPDKTAQMQMLIWVVTIYVWQKRLFQTWLIISFCLAQLISFFMKLSEIPSTIKIGSKAIDNHCMKSTMSGEAGEMVDNFRLARLQEYYDVVELCELSNVPLSRGLLEKGNF